MGEAKRRKENNSYPDYTGRRKFPGKGNIRLWGKSKQFRFTCDQCGKCCSQPALPIFITPYDMISLSCYLGKETKELLDKGKIILKGLKLGIPRPRPFYDNTCTVYEARPDVCRRFPVERVFDTKNGGNNAEELIVLQRNCSDLPDYKQKAWIIGEWFENQVDYDPGFEWIILIQELKDPKLYFPELFNIKSGTPKERFEALIEAWKRYN